METFVLQNGWPKRRKGLLLVRLGVWFLLATTGYFVLDSVWRGSLRSATERLIQAVLWSAFMVAFAVLRARQSPKNQTITIDGDVLVFKSNGKFRKICLGDIQTVVEMKSSLMQDGGLMVSDKSLFRARMLDGYLWIPQESPDYDYLKNVIRMRSKPVG